MWRVGSMFFTMLVICNSNLVEVCGDEIRGEQYPNYEYTQIFKGVPALFEYLLNAVEEKPEMLEKNDITMFKRTVEQEDIDHATNKSPEESDNCNIEAEVYEENDKSKNTGHAKQPTSTVAYEYGKSILKGNSQKDNCKVGVKRETNLVYDRPENKIIKNQIRKRSADENELYLYYSDPDYEDVVWSNEEGHPGFQHLFGLDVQPDEIKEGTLLTEKLLEDYNYKRKH